MLKRVIQYSQQFTTQIVLTTKCNFACKYCYMHNEDSSMTDENLLKISSNTKNFLKQYNCTSYIVNYFGGEPLLEFDLIKRNDHLFKNDPLCNMRVIISNGYLLTNEIADFIQEQNIGFSWSFDGLGNMADRVDLNGESTLARYIELFPIIKRVSPYSCKTTISSKSYKYMLENYLYISEELGIPNIDFTLTRDNDWQESDIELFSEITERLKNQYIRDIKNGKRMTIGFLNLALMDMIVAKKLGKRPFSCFAGNSGLGFMPDGKAYGCARFGTNNSYPIYNYIENEWNEENFNHLYDDKLFNPRKYSKCAGCAIYEYCNGGCNFNQLSNNYEPLEIVCKLFKIIYSAALDIFEKLKDNENFIQSLTEGLKNSG